MKLRFGIFLHLVTLSVGFVVISLSSALCHYLMEYRSASSLGDVDKYYLFEAYFEIGIIESVVDVI